MPIVPHNSLLLASNIELIFYKLFGFVLYINFVEVDNLSESGQSVRSARINGEADSQDFDHQFMNTNMQSIEDADEDFIYDDKGSEELASMEGGDYEAEEYRENNEERLEERSEKVKVLCYDDGSPISDEDFDL